MNRRGAPTPKLVPDVYEQWLKENPKFITSEGVELTEAQNPSDLQAEIILPARRFESDVLPERFQNDLVIYGFEHRFAGMKIWATIEGYDFLLMAHETHHQGNFQTESGEIYANHPHFEEINYFAPDGPGKRRQVPDDLAPDMGVLDFVEAFLDHYYFSPSSTEVSENGGKEIHPTDLGDFEEGEK